MKLSILFFLFASLSIGVATENLSLNEFLATADSEVSLKNRDQKLEYLKEYSSNMPMLDEVEFRYKNEGFSRHRYSLRLSPTGIGETGAANRFHKSILGAQESKRDLGAGKALRRRYNLVVKYLYQNTLLEILSGLETVYEDQLKVIRKKGEDKDFKVNKYIKTEDDLIEIRLKKFEEEKDLETVNAKIKECLPQGAVLSADPSDILTIEEIKEAVEKGNFGLDSGNIYLHLSRKDLALSKSRYDLEKAQSRRYLNLLELGFDHGEYNDQIEDREEGKNYDLNRALYFQVGFTLPFINTDRVNINRRKMDYFSEERRHEELKSDLEREIERHVGLIKKYLWKYDHLKKRDGHISSEASLETYLKVEGIDPDILLEAKELSLKSRQKMERLKLDIYEAYIDLMDLTGAISKKPYHNLLSKNNEPIKMP